MIDRYVKLALIWLKRVVTQPREELTRWQQAARFAYDLGRFGTRQLQHDRAPQMAAALAFRALFGLVPVLVVATVLVRAIIGIDEFLGLIDQLLAWAELDNLQISRPGQTAGPSRSLAEWLDELIGRAATINLTAIGWVGLAVVIYSAIGLLATIENAFNIIYRAPDGRSWFRRVPLYWFLLTASPVAIGLVTWLNTQMEGWLATVAAWQWVLVSGRFVWTCLVAWLLVFAGYTLIPNTSVEARPAAIGALVTVALLETGKRLLGATLANTFSISELYGSLGLIPLFMFWVYLMWLAVLFGLQVSATLQMLHGRQLDEFERRRELRGLVEPTALIRVMQSIADRFQAGGPCTPEQVAESTGLPTATAREIMVRLVDEGLLHSLDGEAGSVCLARPPEEILAAELIEIGFRMLDESGLRPSPFFRELRDAQRNLAAGRTLATVRANPR